MESLTVWKKLGETRDDAAGEAFDKVARLLGLPYPGGPEIEKAALSGDPESTDFPLPMLDSGDYDFSFSGLKTAVLYHLRDAREPNRADVAASFQKSVVDVLVAKTMRAAREFEARSVILSGGVAANKALQESAKEKCNERGLRFFVSPTQYLGDNAAMIATAGHFTKLLDTRYSLEANGNLSI